MRPSISGDFLQIPHISGTLNWESVFESVKAGHWDKEGHRSGLARHGRPAWVDKCEISQRLVTRGQFRKFIHEVVREQDSDYCSVHSGIDVEYWLEQLGNEDEFDALAVLGVTWDEAFAYCVRHSARLPTVLEWEAAVFLSLEMASKTPEENSNSRRDGSRYLQFNFSDISARGGAWEWTMSPASEFWENAWGELEYAIKPCSWEEYHPLDIGRIEVFRTVRKEKARAPIAFRLLRDIGR